MWCRHKSYYYFARNQCECCIRTEGTGRHGFRVEYILYSSPLKLIQTRRLTEQHCSRMQWYPGHRSLTPNEALDT